ncbi:MAG TPA: hypothetical protein VFP50_20085 [Anaeromyxobacteraceae bacterium]|nr:hypothetical protein [Anaeromyxobacteraceae bacterium]
MRLLPALLLLLTAGTASAAPFDEDFELEEAPASLAFGPLRPGHALLFAEGGWLRSGVGVGIGLGAGFDLLVRADTFLLEGTGGQSAAYGGVRLSPFELEPFRFTATIEAGEVFIGGRGPNDDVFSLRTEVLAGVDLLRDWRLYGRGLLRYLAAAVDTSTRWTTDGELGAGLERSFGRWIVGAEVGTWLQPRQDGLVQWRLRVGHAF